VLIDCNACGARGVACDDCVVSVVLDAPAEGVQVDEVERRALEALAGGGLVPRLRLVPLRRQRVPRAG
jgi:hypothetical protein